MTRLRLLPCLVLSGLSCQLPSLRCPGQPARHGGPVRPQLSKSPHLLFAVLLGHAACEPWVMSWIMRG